MEAEKSFKLLTPKVVSTPPLLLPWFSDGCENDYMIIPISYMHLDKSHWQICFLMDLFTKF